MSKIHLSKDTQAKILELYAAYKDYSKVAKELGYNELFISKFIRNGYKEFTGSEVVIKNERFFEKIDTKEKAYWLGIFFTDGNIHKHKKEGGYSVNLSFAVKDTDHLEKFRQAIGCSREIKVRENQGGLPHNGNRYYQAKLSVSRKVMYNDLLSHGVVENKTHNFKIPNLPKELLSSFILGVVDGDGSWFVNNGEYKNTAGFSIVSACLQALKEIQKIIVDNCGFENYKNTIITVEPNLNNKNTIQKSNYHRISYSGEKQCKKLYDWLYTDNSVYLERKKLKAEEGLGIGEFSPDKVAAKNAIKEEILQKEYKEHYAKIAAISKKAQEMFVKNKRTRDSSGKFLPKTSESRRNTSPPINSQDSCQVELIE